jgi:NDP-sugar pyrophosphorylase family protein
MKAMVFAAGVGSRLGPLTKDTPKCLMSLGDQTILEHVLERLIMSGVTSVAINLHHHADKIVEFLRSKNNLGLEITYSREDVLLDTGGGLKKLRAFFENEDAFIIHNSDIYSLCDLSALVAEHRNRKAVGTLAVMDKASARGLYFDHNNVLVGWTQESQGAPEDGKCMAFTGISVASGELFSFMEERDTFSLIRPYVTASRATQRVWGAVITADDWVDIGTPDQLAALRARIAERP